MNTKQKIQLLAEQYMQENGYKTSEFVYKTYDYELSDFIKTLGDQVHKDFKTPQIYWNEVQGDGDAYTFVSMYSDTLKKSIILDWDSKIYRLNDTEEIIDELVKVWDEAEALEAKLSISFNK